MAREEVERVKDQTTPRTPVIYETVRQNGDEEMDRPAASLWWSGLAAGLSLSFSLLAQAILREHLPEADWRDLVAALGYPVGFMMAVLSRQQLFTENTITVVLPVMADPSRKNFARGARMWGIVLAANLVGTLFAATFCTWTPVITDGLRDQMLEISRQSLDYGAFEMGLRAMTAGYIMAAMVWLLPGAGAAQFHVVALMTYIIGAGGYSHIVAGSMEAFMLMMNGDLSVGDLVTGFAVPTLAGNILGGTALFAVIAHAQVMKEMES